MKFQMIETLFDISDKSRTLMVIDCIYLTEKNGIKWNGINESMSQNDFRDIRRRFQRLFFVM